MYGVVMENLILHQSPARPRNGAGQLSLPGLNRDVSRPPASRPAQPLSRVARATGYDRARRRSGHQASRLLAFLRAHGPQTDHDCAAGLELPLASVNALRNGLVKRGLVVAVDHRPGPYGPLRTRWGLR